MQSRFFKFIFALLFALFINAAAFCAPINPVVKAIDNTELGRNSVVSIAVRDLKTGDTVFSRRPNIFLNPASSLKVFTMASALDSLGEKYHFETILYIDDDKNVYLKLGADPLLTSSDLDTLAKSLKQAYCGRIKNFYIDDTIIDKVPYPDGWTVDDYWPNAPKISPYIVDGNIVSVNFSISKNGKGVEIFQNNDYRFSFINELEIGAVTNIIPSLNYGETSGIVSLTGTVSKDIVKDFPVLDTARFFTVKLRKALDDNGISYSKPFYQKRVPDNVKRIASFRRPIKEVLLYVLKTSNNFATEVTFKVAGGSWFDKVKAAENASDTLKNVKKGSFEAAKLMFFEYYKNAGLKTDKINLKDASGVSRYNTLSTSWMSEALVFLDKNSTIKNYMITSGEGTLSRRMRDLTGNLKAKTGTIFGVSSLTGYLKSLNGADYAFSIIIQNFGERASVVKGLEDDIVNGIYFLE